MELTILQIIIIAAIVLNVGSRIDQDFND